MKLEYKSDFTRTQEQWDLFWKGENKRPNISIVIPKENQTQVEQPPYLSGKDGNFQPVIDQYLAWAQSHEFIGEAIPFAYVEWGPDTFTSFLGSDLKFTPEVDPYTSWCVPYVKDWDEVDIRFRRDSYWWQLTSAFIKDFRKKCDGKILIAPPTLVANLDSLAAMRGIENLLFDLIDCPEKVKKALDAVNQAHTDILNAYEEELSFDIFGSINISGTYCKGRQSRPQCDVSCMLSPEMFREFVKPCLDYETNDTMVADYHLDGKNALRHLDTLAEIKNLDLIEYTISAGNDSTKDWSWVRRKIDDIGKGQRFNLDDRNDIANMWKKYKSKKQIIRINAHSRMEAEDIIAEAEKLELFEK